jgi:tetratricopeptide (TPR) repeat protein
MASEKWDDAIAEFELVARLAGKGEKTAALLESIKKAVERRDALQRKETIDVHAQRARDYYKAGQFTEATAEFETILEIDPENEFARRGIHAIRKAKRDEAGAEQEKEVLRLVADGEKSLRRAKSESGVEQAEELARAGNRFGRALALDPSNRRAKVGADEVRTIAGEREKRIAVQSEVRKHWEAAIAYGKDEDAYEKCVAELEIILSLDRGHKQAAQMLRAFEEKIRRRDEARRRQREEEAGSRLAAARELHAARRYKEALAEIAESTRLDPGNEEAQKLASEIGIALKETGRRDADSARAEQARTLRARADEAARRGNEDQAAELYRLSLERRQDAETERKYRETVGETKKEQDAVADHVRRAQEDTRAGRLEQAQADVELGEVLAPGDPRIAAVKEDLRRARVRKDQAGAAETDGILAAADAHYRAGRYEEANKLAQSVLARDRSNLRGRILLAKCQKKLGYAAEEEGSAGSRRLTTAQEQEVARRYYRGLQHYIRGDLALAEDEWQAVLKIDPEHLKTQDNIRKLRRKRAFVEAAQ